MIWTMNVWTISRLASHILFWYWRAKRVFRMLLSIRLKILEGVFEILEWYLMFYSLQIRNIVVWTVICFSFEDFFFAKCSALKIFSFWGDWGRMWYEISVDQFMNIQGDCLSLCITLCQIWWFKFYNASYSSVF